MPTQTLTPSVRPGGGANSSGAAFPPVPVLISAGPATEPNRADRRRALPQALSGGDSSRVALPRHTFQPRSSGAGAEPYPLAMPISAAPDRTLEDFAATLFNPEVPVPAPSPTAAPHATGPVSTWRPAFVTPWPTAVPNTPWPTAAEPIRAGQRRAPLTPPGGPGDGGGTGANSSGGALLPVPMLISTGPPGPIPAGADADIPPPMLPSTSKFPPAAKQRPRGKATTGTGKGKGMHTHGQAATLLPPPLLATGKGTGTGKAATGTGVTPPSGKTLLLPGVTPPLPPPIPAGQFRPNTSSGSSDDEYWPRADEEQHEAPAIQSNDDNDDNDHNDEDDDNVWEVEVVSGDLGGSEDEDEEVPKTRRCRVVQAT
jgi:hypothetical protein